ncbi:hypothetical protein F2Q68_00014767 [Brassica cretica]|uniref:Uncharacterized protein n=1 Tax=Brassica cretica TaxID=69181 RepID=A0A8S9HU99_BRACR|nr:hypothetical protein F2Q68_00014767 [Brassica cretica]
MLSPSVGGGLSFWVCPVNDSGFYPAYKGQLGHGDMIQRDRPTKENKQLDTEIHMNYIYDVHVSNYMKMLNEDQPEKYQTHFSQYLKKGVDSEGMEELVIVLVL